MRFSERQEHSVFLELEGWETTEVYVQGTSDSLPADVQLRVLRSMPGLEGAEMTRPGYAIEYDYVGPSGLLPTMECRAIPVLYLAGQLNGTSGYEEAAAQGLVAGANAALSRLGAHELTVDRSEGYVGVWIDGLIHHHADEPYRILTSRAEHRLSLGHESAYARLTGKAVACRLVSKERAETVERELEMVECEAGDGEGGVRARSLAGQGAKYRGYRRRAVRCLGSREMWLGATVPQDLRFEQLPMKEEVRSRIAAAGPGRVGDVLQIPGVTPADAATLAAYVRRHAGRGDVSRET
jgi:tRNA uridine 5-carboxymethylaminomethyl modification enzyme